MNTYFRRALTGVVAGTLTLGPPSLAQSQIESNRTLTVIVAYPPGSAVDVVTRQYVRFAANDLKRTIVIENKSGGGGTLGAQALKNSPRDGSTLLVIANGSLTIAPHMRSMPYSIGDFAPVSALFGFSQLLIMPGQSPVRTIDELIALAKSKPAGLTFSSFGAGSVTHILCVLVEKASGTKMSHVPYNNTGQYMIDLTEGRIDFSFGSYQSTQSFYGDGKLKYILATGEKRSSVIPDIPTSAEVGYKDLSLTVWFALLAPTGTPDDVVARLHKAFRFAADQPDLQERMTKDAIENMASTPEEAVRKIAEESRLMKSLIADFRLITK